MKRIIFLLLLLFICSCTKEKVDENHYFISAFDFVNEKDGDEYPMSLRCEFMIHLYHDSIQFYQNTKNEVLWGEKIKAKEIDAKLIKSILKNELYEAQVADFPREGIICRGPSVKGPYFFGSFSSSQNDLFNPIDLKANEKIEKLIKKLKLTKKGIFSSIIYKEIFFQTTWMNLNGYEDIPEAQKQIQFLPPVVN